MNMPLDASGALSPYRVLDLTDAALSLCGKFLADLGADVIKVEPPQGDASRRIGPFYKDMVDPDKSLFWWAYNVNKRGITLDIATAEGRDLFVQLCRSCDFVIESFEPHFLDSLGIGYDALRAINPRIILASITPYGQEGPRAAQPWCDLTAWASSGMAYITGDSDRAPLCMGFPPQISAQAASELMTAMMIAHYEREISGEGQHIDLSIQESAIGLLQATVEMWDLSGFDYKRSGGSWLTSSGAARRLVFDCSDGYAVLLQGGGGSVRMVASSRNLVEWMAEHGMAPDWLRTFDWENDYNADTLTQETVDRVEAAVARFLLTRTKSEIYLEGWRRGITIAPANDMREIAHSEQLMARGFWEEVAHPELDDRITYCGAFTKMSETPLTTRRRPPLLGEHNDEIYGQELHMTEAVLAELKSAGVI